jgi:uncharacterized protein YbjQ (UPF0145 family)
MEDWQVDLVWTLLSLSLSFGPFIVSATAGVWYQNRLLAELATREQATMAAYGGRDPLTSVQEVLPKVALASGSLLVANVTIGPSWWQMLLAQLKSLVGGRLEHFDRVLEFGRREALQRLREAAQQQGWDDVVNVRLDTTVVAVNKANRSRIGAMEIFAYGTGVKRAALTGAASAAPSTISLSGAP